MAPAEKKEMSSASENSQLPAAKAAAGAAEGTVEFAKCDCCGLTEECTPAYISKVRERYEGLWICGLCGEAVKDEILRSERRIGADEALSRHMNFCRKFRSSSPPTANLISAVKQLLRRSLDSPRSSPTWKKQQAGSLRRSKGLFANLDD